jgi:hypothetical protein
MRKCWTYKKKSVANMKPPFKFLKNLQTRKNHTPRRKGRKERPHL